MYGPNIGLAAVSMHELDADQAAQRADQADLGPKGPRCSKCRRPKWSVIGLVPTKLAPEQGGCACPRYSEPPAEYQAARTREDRQESLMERLVLALEALCGKLQIEVPGPAPRPPEPKAEPAGVAAIDQIRSQDKTRRAS